MVFLGTTIKCPPWGISANTTSPYFNDQVMCQHPVKHSTPVVGHLIKPLIYDDKSLPILQKSINTSCLWQFPDSLQLPCRNSIDTKTTQTLRHGFSFLSSLCFSNIILYFPYRMAPRASCYFLCTIYMEELCQTTRKWCRAGFKPYQGGSRMTLSPYA